VRTGKVASRPLQGGAGLCKSIDFSVEACRKNHFFLTIGLTD
jgi:hypothetical protein